MSFASYSFSSCHSVQFRSDNRIMKWHSDLLSLESISFANNAFGECHSVQFGSHDSWWIDNQICRSFSLCLLAVMLLVVVIQFDLRVLVDKKWYSDLPRFESLYLFQGAFQGDGGDDQKANSSAPFNYQNTLTMKSCE